MLNLQGFRHSLSTLEAWEGALLLPTILPSTLLCIVLSPVLQSLLDTFPSPMDPAMSFLSTF